MKSIPRVVIAGLALLMLATPTAVAGNRGGDSHHRPSVVPAGRVAGNSGQRLLGDWFVENLSRPADRSPFGQTTNLCLDIGRRGKVLAPAGGVLDDDLVIEMSCTARAGQPIVLVMTSAECSSAEPKDGDFYAATAREQRKCALRNINSLPVQSITVRVDNGRPVDIYRPRFFEVTQQRRVVFPDNAVFDATAGPATFVAAAWMAEIRGLRKGNYTVTAVATYLFDPAEPLVLPFIVHFTIV